MIGVTNARAVVVGLLLAAMAILVGGGRTEAASPSPAASPAGERRIALVIGNGAYKESPLKNPVNDSRAVAQRFKKLGFEVIALENATQAQMNKAITQFGERLTDTGAAVFYYAGHGMQVKGRNFLVPVDAEISSEASVRNSTVDVEQLLDAIGEPSKRTNIVILDACRNNPFGRFRGSGGGLAQVSAPAGTLVAYATAPGMTASDGDGQNGAYTAEILKALDEPGLKVEDVFKKVRANVAQATGNAQVPWEASSLVGDFYFVPKGSTVVVVPPGGQMPNGAAAGGESVEVTFWNSIKGSKDPALYKAYLERYPNGSFVPIAKSRLDELTVAAASPGASRPADARAPAVGGGTTRFDGVWSGHFACGNSRSGGGPLEGARGDFKIVEGRLTGDFSYHQNKSTGSESYTGSVGPDGDVMIVGRGNSTVSPNYPISLRGKATDTTMVAAGNLGSRECTIEYARKK